MTIELLKAILVGVIAAVPVGPVLLMVIQKTLCRGKAAGIMTGLGSAVADMIYAAVGLFTLSLIQDFIRGHEALIMLAGGAILMLIGLNILLKEIKLSSDETASSRIGLWSCAMQSASSALSNPAALAVMLALLAGFGFGADEHRLPALLVVIGVFVGEWLYWIVLVSLMTGHIRLKEKHLQLVSRLAGSGICCFAAVLIVRAIILFVR